MKRYFITFVGAILLTGAGLLHGAESYLRPFEPDPTRFHAQIEQYGEDDAQQPPAANGVVVVGSSSIRRWHGIHEDFAPLEVIARGFGGSQTSDAIYYVDELILKYRPRALVLYEGENDIAFGKTPERVLEDFRFLVAHCRQQLPDLRVYVISLKPAPSRWEVWPDMQAANELLRNECTDDENLTFIDITGPMLTGDGTPRLDIFVEDNLHMNELGYALWRETIRPVLLQNEYVTPRVSSTQRGPRKFRR